VVVTNCEKIYISGKKAIMKQSVHASRSPAGLRPRWVTDPKPSD
jgi:ribosomal protein L13